MSDVQLFPQPPSGSSDSNADPSPKARDDAAPEGAASRFSSPPMFGQGNPMAAGTQPPAPVPAPTPAAPPAERTPWGADELTEAVHAASPHVKFLLKELSKLEEAPARELTSKRVAYAIVQRICNSQNKDSLVLSRIDPSGEKVYRLNPTYRSAVTPLVENAPEPPPTPAKPPRPKTPGMGRGRRGPMSAMDGIAMPTSSLPAPSMAPQPAMRRVAQVATGRTITFPPETSLEFCQELMAFLNATSPARYRVVLDSQGPRLEVS